MTYRYDLDEVSERIANHAWEEHEKEWSSRGFESAEELQPHVKDILTREDTEGFETTRDREHYFNSRNGARVTIDDTKPHGGTAHPCGEKYWDSLQSKHEEETGQGPDVVQGGAYAIHHDLRETHELKKTEQELSETKKPFKKFHDQDQENKQGQDI